MRAWLGWVAAALLIALACTGGPDVIDTTPSTAQSTVSASEIADKREPQVRDDDADVGHQIVDRSAPGRPRLLALPPSSQNAAPVPARAATLVLPGAPAPTIPEGGPQPHLGACTREALQIFRC